MLVLPTALGAIHCDLTGSDTLLAPLIIGLMTMSAQLRCCYDAQKHKRNNVLYYCMDFLICGVFKGVRFSSFAVVDPFICAWILRFETSLNESNIAIWWSQISSL
jgi:hypothetical protein